MSEEIINETNVNEEKPDLTYLISMLKDAIIAESPHEIKVPLDENGEFVNLCTFEDEEKTVGNLKIKIAEDIIRVNESDPDTFEPTTKFSTTVRYSYGEDTQSHTLEHHTEEEVSFAFDPDLGEGFYADVGLCIKALDGSSLLGKEFKLTVS